MPSDAIIVFVTAASAEEAAALAKALVAERLAACANIIPAIRSIYRWEGEVQDATEALMVIKTRREHFSALEARVRALHSYSVPEIVAVDMAEGSAPYMAWLRDST